MPSPFTRASAGAAPCRPPKESPFFRLRGAALSLYPLEDLAADAGVAPSPLPAFRGIALAHNVRAPEEVDRIAALAVQLGGTLLAPPEHKFWGGYDAYFTDPDGHLWEIAWNPGFPLDEAGNLQIPA